MHFDFPDDLAPNWHATMPEFSCAANAVSLMMPYVEPYVVRAMRQTLPHLEGELHDQARHYIAQEASTTPSTSASTGSSPARYAA